MLWSIPSPETQINTSNEGNGVVNDAYLLVMRPEKCVLPELVGGSLHENVLVEVEQRELGVF